MTRIPAAALLLAGLLFATAASPQSPPSISGLEAVPRIEVAAAAVQHALAEAPRKEAPYRFAVAVPARLTLADGRWEVADGRTAVWRLRIHSAGAHSLSLRLSPLAIPPGGTVQLVDAASGFAQRPYAAPDSRPGGAWTPMVPGEDLVLVATVPVEEKDLLELGVTSVFHGFRDWQPAAQSAVTPKNGGDAGACNINVACSQGAPWAAEARAVALITVANQYVCSGQLLNNVRQDQAPLFLTADHCGIGTAERDVGDASSVNFYFDYQALACSTPPQPRPAVPNVQGSTFLADDVQSDFTLLRLNLAGSNRLPADAYFAGWSALGQGSTSGVAIHHPSGDEKKISVYTAPIVQAAVDIGATCTVDAWQVEWSQGTTEPGSSGGGLWSSTHHLIGVLSGGNASCQNPSGADYFARIDRGWTANATPRGQLKTHLDPDGTCIAEIPGLDPQVTPNASPITSGPTRCEGQASSCGAGGGGGGGAMGADLLALLVLARRRARRLPPPSAPDH